MQFFHADLAYLQFFAKSAVDPKYALVCVDLFSSKIYVYTMRKKSNLAQKMELFYKEIEKKRNQKKNEITSRSEISTKRDKKTKSKI